MDPRANLNPEEDPKTVRFSVHILCLLCVVFHCSFLQKIKASTHFKGVLCTP